MKLKRENPPEKKKTNENINRENIHFAFTGEIGIEL